MAVIFFLCDRIVLVVQSDHVLGSQLTFNATMEALPANNK